jgi:hypothetical protein
LWSWADELFGSRAANGWQAKSGRPRSYQVEKFDVETAMISFSDIEKTATLRCLRC